VTHVVSVSPVIPAIALVAVASSQPIKPTSRSACQVRDAQAHGKQMAGVKG
jgi:hypothetical protein